MQTELEKILQNQPRYRVKQIQKAWFDTQINGYDQITTLPIELREQLKDLSWLSVKQKTIVKSQVDNTEKALLELSDGKLIETVLLGRENTKESREADERYTICISSQVGCAMNCVFCATGKSGFKRNLTVEEIVDQYRFWQKQKDISNIVIMGQGEPLLNYENIKQSLNIILENTLIGPTKITLSTCGVPEMMDKLLLDKDFPQVRLAVSLHSAIEETRKEIMPSHKKGFLDFLIDWSNRYYKLIPSRSHFIGLEHLMLKGINDDQTHLKALIKLANKIPRVRINLIPYNETTINEQLATNTGELKGTDRKVIENWQEALMAAGFTCTIRQSQGQDIDAACGQLCNKASGYKTSRF